MASAPARRNPRTVRAASLHGSGLEVRSEGIARAGRELALLRFSARHRGLGR